MYLFIIMIIIVSSSSSSSSSLFDVLVVGGADVSSCVSEACVKVPQCLVLGLYSVQHDTCVSTSILCAMLVCLS